MTIKAQGNPARPDETEQDAPDSEKTISIRALPKPLAWLPATITSLLLLMTLDYLFNFGWFLFVSSLETQFYYSVVTLLLPLVFLLWPAAPSLASKPVPWYDYALSLLTLITGAYFVVHAEPILERGWAFAAPDLAIYFSYLFWVLIIEAARRAGGWPIAIIAAVFSLYPLVADVMPGPIQAFSSSLSETAMYHTMSTESVMGIPLQAFASLVVGFLVFGVVLQKTGGGEFFYKPGVLGIGACSRWSGQGVHFFKRVDGLDEWQCHQQCSDHRHSVHSRHAAHRHEAIVCGRCRGLCLYRWRAYAAGNGKGKE